MTYILYPPPFPDETIGSVVRRSAIVSPRQCERRFRRVVLGQPWRGNDEKLISPMLSFYRVLGRDFMSMRDWLEHHSFFAYYSIGLDVAGRRELLRRVLYGCKGPLYPVREPNSLWPVPRVVRGCPECDLESELRDGILYVRRAHISPFVTRCPWHGAFLLDPSRDEAVTAAVGVRWSASNEGARLSNARRYAEASTNAIQRGVTEAAAFDVCEVRMRELGYLARDNVRLQRLSVDVCNYYSAGFEDLAMSSLVSTPQAVAKWLGRAFGRRRSIHPALAILLEGFIEQAEPLAQVRKNGAPRRAPQITDAQYSDALNVNPSFCKAANALGVSVATVSAAAARLGLSERLRKKTNDLIDDELLAELRNARPIAELVTSSGRSQAYIYRLLRKNPDVVTERNSKLESAIRNRHRDRWQSHCAEHPGISPTQLRRTCQKSWTWLYRNDRDWLKASRPKTAPAAVVKIRRADREQLERAMTAATSIFEYLLRERGRPRQVTRARVALLAGLTDQSLRNVNGMLNRRGEPIGEERADFAKRRLAWTRQELPPNQRIVVWRLVRKASLRKASIDRLLGGSSKATKDTGL
ncbi:TnsD family Tn7-like transposition protein [Burkholderia sp. BCC1977]|uniref:TnsD family Tn7-like transposition protein n=1 Tax=Burkholderia sp. BCC1977 TaxID=2817440 RepID=UPI002ABD83C9|nr:TnsD family Tn7-like transposition protein [Burkholderia sp. BCC1977]